MATLKDIAKVAGVSTATVSRALNDSASISAQTKKLVHEAAISLNYKSNRNAQPAEYKKQTIAVMAPQIVSPVYATLLSGIQDAAMARNFAVLLFCAEGDPVSEKKAMDLLLSMGASGVIAIPPATQQTNYVPLLEAPLPLVFAGYRPPTQGAAHTVALDIYEGTALATEHLVKQGMQSIVLIAGPENTHVFKERSNAYLEVMKSHALTPSIYTGLSTYYAGFQLGTHLFEERGGQRIDAVMAGSDYQSLGILHAIQKSGRKVPEDVSLVSLNDTFLTAMSVPALTSVSYPLYRMGARAFETLFEDMQGVKPENKTELFKPVLTFRQSTTEGGQA